MTQPVAKNSKKPAAEKAEDFEFEQSSDLCDFGFALVETGAEAQPDAQSE